MADIIPQSSDLVDANDINTKMKTAQEAKVFIENLTKEITGEKFTSFENAKAMHKKVHELLVSVNHSSVQPGAVNHLGNAEPTSDQKDLRVVYDTYRSTVDAQLKSRYTPQAFDALSVQDIQNLSQTANGTTMLLTKLAQRTAVKNGTDTTQIESRDLQPIDSNQDRIALQGKINAMDKAISSFGNEITDPKTQELLNQFRTLNIKTSDAVQQIATDTRTRLDEVRGSQGMSEQSRALRGYILGLSHDTSEVNLTSLIDVVSKLDGINASQLTKDDFKKNGYNESGLLFQDKELGQLKDLVNDIRTNGGSNKLKEKAKQVQKIDDALIKLERTDIGSLFQALSGELTKSGKLPEHITNDALAKMGYSPNGAISMLERGAIESIIQVINSGGLDKGTVAKIGEYYGRGLTSVDLRNEQGALRGIDLGIDGAVKDGKISDLVSYLSVVTRGVFRGEDMKKVLDGMSEEQQVSAIARLSGVSAKSFAELKTEYQKHPESLKAKFLDNFNAGVSTGMSYQEVLMGNKQFLEKKEKTMSEALLKALNEAGDKATAEVTVMKDGPEKARLEQFVADLNKVDTKRFTGKFQKVAEGMFANIGENANGAGIGVTYEAFVKGLTITPGIGMIDGQPGGGFALHYNIGTAKLHEGEKTSTTISAGVGAGGLTTFVPFADVGLRNVDNVQTFDTRLGDISARTLNITGSELGGSITVGLETDKDGEIAQTAEKLRKSIADLAIINPSSLDAKSLAKVLGDAGFKGMTDTNSVQLLNRIQEIYTSLGVDANTTPFVKAQILNGLFNSEMEKLQVADANTTVDARSAMGGGIGAGMILGVPFPLAYIKFYKRKTAYTEATQEAVTVAQETPQQAQEQTASMLQLVESTGNAEFAEQMAKYAQFFLDSRGRKANGVSFNDFQAQLIAGNVANAYGTLTKYLQGVSTYKKNPQRANDAKIVLELISKTGIDNILSGNEKERNAQMLRDINVLTSGSILTRAMRNMKTPADRIKAFEKNRQMFNKLADNFATNYLGSSVAELVKKMYEPDAFKQILSQEPKSLNGKQLGVVTYSQTKGGAKGLDGLPTGAQYYEGQRIDQPDVKLLDLIFTEYPGRRQELIKQLSITQEEFNQVMLGKSIIRKEDGAEISGANMQYQLAYSGAKEATCYNAMVIMSGSLSIKPLGKPPVPVNPVNPSVDFRAGKFSSQVETSVAGLSNYNKEEKPVTPPPKTEEPVDDTDTTPGARPVSKPVVTTTPEANANQNSNSNTGGETQNVGQNTSQSLEGTSTSASASNQASLSNTAEMNTNIVTETKVNGGFKK